MTVMATRGILVGQMLRFCMLLGKTVRERPSLEEVPAGFAYASRVM